MPEPDKQNNEDNQAEEGDQTGNGGQAEEGVRAMSADPIAHINKKVEGFFGQLVQFLKEWSVISIAVGFIVAEAAKDFVDAVVNGLIIPFFKLIFKTDQLGSLTFSIGAIRFDIGIVLSSFITLIIIIAFLYYFVRRIMKKYGQD